MGASFGNAGLLAQWAVVPVTTPSLWTDAPKYLLNRNSPLFLKWGYLPKLAPWLFKFMSQATDEKTRTFVENISPLLNDAVDQHRSLARGTPIERWIANSKFNYVYSDQSAYEADAYSWELKRAAGFVPNLITGNDVADFEPILGPSSRCLAVIENQGHILNPAQYIKELVTHFEHEGGTFKNAEVVDFEKQSGCISSVVTKDGKIDCGHAVITSGIWSKELMQKLGLKVPLETERGYHVLYEDPSEVPRNPMMITKGKFGVNPMETGLRCAGTVELGDHYAGPSKAPIELLRRHVKEVCPNLANSKTKEFMAYRTSTPDS
jgi:D-amino-acid dehydrogenase